MPLIDLSKNIFSINSYLPPEVKVSFEFFPPKDDAMEAKLWETVQKLEPLAPRFVSVTYGAGGTTREKTHALVKRIKNETSLTPAAHLTCVGASKTEIDEVVRAYWDAGIRHIVALRGDPPANSGKYVPHPDGYAYAVDLVKGIKNIANFDISVAAYAETHPDATSPKNDLDHLKQKIDAGASRAITQYFFEVSDYLNFMERAVKAGINTPIIPGILPVTNVEQLIRFSSMCGAKVPKWLVDLFDGLDKDPITRNLVAATVAAEQCRMLYAHGVREFHFYTLNRAELSFAICHILGIRRKG